MSSGDSNSSKPVRTWRPRTRQVRGGLERTGFSETSEAMFLTSGYVYGSAAEAEASFDGTLDRMVYSRFKNPTVAMFEHRRPPAARRAPGARCNHRIY